MQRIRRLNWAHHVISPLDNDTGNAGQAIDLLNYPAIGEKAMIDKIVRLQTRHGEIQIAFSTNLTPGLWQQS